MTNQFPAAGAATREPGGGAPEAMRVAQLAKIGIGMDVDVERDEHGAFHVRYAVIIVLHGRATGTCRVVLKVGRGGRVLREFEPELRCDTVARLSGHIGLRHAIELVCEAYLLDDPDARGTAFAWIGPAASSTGTRKVGAEADPGDKP